MNSVVGWERQWPAAICLYLLFAIMGSRRCFYELQAGMYSRQRSHLVVPCFTDRDHICSRFSFVCFISVKQQ